MKKFLSIFLLSASILSGCGSDEIPQAHRGRMFDKTGALALYSGGKGFEGPVLNPGTYYTGMYPELRSVECAESTDKETLSSLTKDGVQFDIEVFVRNKPNCSDEAIKWILANISPDADAKEKHIGRVSADALYKIYVTPALHSAMRKAVALENASDMNDKRGDVTKTFHDEFEALTKENSGHPKVVLVEEIAISNFNFPSGMQKANQDLALQATLTKVAIATREKNEQDQKTEQANIKAKIETQKLNVELEETWAKAQAASMKVLARTIKENPEWLQYDYQQKLPTITENLGKSGNMIMMNGNSSNFLWNLNKK